MDEIITNAARRANIHEFITSLPEGHNTLAGPRGAHIPTGQRQRWKEAQHLIDLFWHRWLREYHPMLQTRSKWLDIKCNLQPGDLVVVNNPDTPRGLWRKAIVKQVYYDQDGRVRTVRLKTATQEVERGIRSVCLLEEADNLKVPGTRSQRDDRSHGVLIVTEIQTSPKMSPVTKASHNQSLPVYPMDELLKARSEFRYRWRRRMTENPLARLIITDHYRYPPNIILKNWEKYPFDETGDESDKRQFLSTMSDKMRNRIIMLKTQPYIPSEIYDNMISEEDFQHVCSLLSNEVCITENYFQSISQNQCISACYFICDNCDFLGTNEDAVEHLKQTGHSTCSKYTPIYYVDDSDTAKPCELKEPRVITYQPDRIYGWSIGDSVICCPTCKLTFPDKLMCAYHHELQHPQGERLYTYGKVLIVKDLKIHRSLICSNCQIGFSTIEGFTQHCIDSTRCDSSFFSSLFNCQTSLPSSHSVIILSVLCKFCERSFSTVLTPEAWFTAQSTTSSSSSRKRKHPQQQQEEEEEWNTENYSKTDYQPSSSSVSCGKDFSRFCLSHAFQHIDRENLQSCHLSLRVIDISKSVECRRLPPIHGISHSTTVLLFSLYECKRLVLYLKKYYGGSFYLLKDAEKHLKDLLAQAALILSPYFLYDNIFS